MPIANSQANEAERRESGFRSSSFLTRYGFAISMIVLATGVRLALAPIYGNKGPYSFFLIASLLTAWLAGTAPGVLVAVVGGVVGTYAYVKPQGFQALTVTETIALVTYLAVAILAMAISASERRSFRAREDAVVLANLRLQALDGERIARSEALEKAFEAQQDSDQSRRDLARVLAGVSDGLLLMDRDLQVLEINEEAADILETQREAILGRVFEKVWPQGREMSLRYRSAMEEGQTARFDYQTRVKRWYDVSAYPSSDGLAVFFQDVTDRYAAEVSLRASEDRYRTLTNALPAIVWSSLPDGTLESYNDRWYEYTGERRTSPPEWGRDRIHPEERSLVDSEWHRARLTGEPFESEYRIRDKNGNFRWFFARALPSRNDAGNIVRWLGAATDIHEIRLARVREEFLNTLEQTLRPVRDPEAASQLVCQALRREFDVSRAMFALVDGDRGEVLANDSTGVAPLEGFLDLKAFGAEVPAALRNGATISSRDTLVDARFKDLEAFAAIQTISFVAVPLLKDGGLRAILSLNHDAPRNWSENEVALLAEVGARAWDSVERILAEKAIEASESRFRALAEASPNLVFMTDRERSILFVNRYLLDYTGLTMDETMGKTPEAMNILEPSDREKLSRDWQHAATEGVEVRREVRLRAKQGDYRWFEVRIVPLLDDSGKITRWVGSGTDIHDRKSEGERLEKIVKERTRELAESNQELERFCYSVSHDLRAPLRAIMSASMIVLEDFGPEIDPLAQSELKRQARAAKQMGELIDDLLQLSRIGRTDVERKPLDLAVLARGVWDDLREPGELVAPESIPCQGDARLLRLLLQNLLENTVKYAKPDTPPCVEVGEENGVFYVKDSGIGMDPTYAEKVFEPFQRLHQDSEIAGTGIGLSNVRRIAERHGGKAWLESQPGVGTTVKFTLAP